jgi:L,D-peptidoglycan transpeptidase YkuD (ErfK/YbiS/YcfS/YnhG family)
MYSRNRRQFDECPVMNEAFREVMNRRGGQVENIVVSKSYGRATRNPPLAAIWIRPSAGNSRRGWLCACGMTVPVALGRSGVRANKREGDGGTPKGTFRPLRLWWRADRHMRPQTFLPVRAITDADAWCEDPSHRHYNRPIRLARGQNGDRLKRNDHLYDFVVEIDHNTKPRVAGRGSAVFLHLARDNFGPTAGCVSMTKSAMLRLLRRLSPHTRIVIG